MLCICYNENYINIHLVLINFQVFLCKVTEKLYYSVNSNESLMKSFSLIQWTKPAIYSGCKKCLARKSVEALHWVIKEVHMSSEGLAIKYIAVKNQVSFE